MAGRKTSSPADRRKNSARKKTERRGSKPSVREYHVVPNGKRWDIERDHAFTGSFAYEVHTAIGLATAEAQRDVHNGVDAVVCVTEKDGYLPTCLALENRQPSGSLCGPMWPHEAATY